MDIIADADAAMKEQERIQMSGSLSRYFTNHVNALVKSGELILSQLTPQTVDLWHAATGVSGEGGELLDAAKKVAVYNRQLDIVDPKTNQTLRQNVIEELGDLEFYMEQVRQNLGITREETLIENVKKLRHRYPQGYSDAAAQERADKTTGVLVTNAPVPEEVPQPT